MVDFAMDVHGTLYPDQEVPQSLVDKRAMVVEKFKELQAETDPVLRIFTEPEVTKQIQASRDSKQLLDFLMKGYDFKTSMIDTCYNFAKFQHECGNYSGASDISTSTGFSSSPLTRTISTACGESWPPKSSCRTGTWLSRTSTGSRRSLTRAPSEATCRPCSRGPGSSTGVCSCSSTIPRGE